MFTWHTDSFYPSLASNRAASRPFNKLKTKEMILLFICKLRSKIKKFFFQYFETYKLTLAVCNQLHTRWRRMKTPHPVSLHFLHEYVQCMGSTMWQRLRNIGSGFHGRVNIFWPSLGTPRRFVATSVSRCNFNKNKYANNSCMRKIKTSREQHTKTQTSFWNRKHICSLVGSCLHWFKCPKSLETISDNFRNNLKITKHKIRMFSLKWKILNTIQSSWFAASVWGIN